MQCCDNGIRQWCNVTAVLLERGMQKGFYVGFFLWDDLDVIVQLGFNRFLAYCRSSWSLRSKSFVWLLSLMVCSTSKTSSCVCRSLLLVSASQSCWAWTSRIWARAVSLSRAWPSSSAYLWTCITHGKCHIRYIDRSKYLSLTETFPGLNTQNRFWWKSQSKTDNRCSIFNISTSTSEQVNCQTKPLKSWNHTFCGLSPPPFHVCTLSGSVDPQAPVF